MGVHLLVDIHPNRVFFWEHTHFKTPCVENIRILLAKRLFTTFYGITLSQWLRLLQRHDFAIDPPFWPRAGFITLTSIATSACLRYENPVYGPKLTNLNIQPPIFILGHWRSGTTHLHNLLSVDEQFAYPNLHQVTNPQTFLSSERVFEVFGLVSPKTRLVDNMSFGFTNPQEDEFAICNTTLLSPCLGWAFPRNEDHYEKYLTFRKASEEEIEQWKAGLLLFLKKLTWKYGRTLVLKGPPHTCRIRLLLELFPEARFIHIHRDPYQVFQSTRRLVKLMYRATGLQRPTMQDVNARIIRRYKLMYDLYFKERELIPDRQFHEVSYQDLLTDPMGQTKKIYEKFNLTGFTATQPSILCYLDSIEHYRQHKYPELPSALRCEIAKIWQDCFKMWGYPQ